MIPARRFTVWFFPALYDDVVSWGSGCRGNRAAYKGQSVAKRMVSMFHCFYSVSPKILYIPIQTKKEPYYIFGPRTESFTMGAVLSCVCCPSLSPQRHQHFLNVSYTNSFRTDPERLRGDRVRHHGRHQRHRRGRQGSHQRHRLAVRHRHLVPHLRRRRIEAQTNR